MKKHTISIITSIYDPDPNHLRGAYESIKSQSLPNDWNWEWVTQEDGHTTAVFDLLPSDSKISKGNGRWGGVSVARNLALSRSKGELVKVLDHDDQLTPGALARDITALTTNPDIGWSTSRVLDLLPDGSTIGFAHDPLEGRIRSGTVFTHWKAHYLANVHPATLCIRRELAFALGGWMALPASGDTGLLLGADAISDGYFIAETGMLYRKWSGQQTNSSAYLDETEQAIRMQMVEHRALALQQLWKRHNLLTS